MQLGVLRQEEAPVRQKKPFRDVGSDAVPDDQQRIVAVNGNEAPVEHPVHSAGQGKAVAHGIRPKVLDRNDMRCLDFRSPTSVAQGKPRHRASPGIGTLDLTREGPVPERSRREDLRAHCFVEGRKRLLGLRSHSSEIRLPGQLSRRRQDILARFLSKPFRQNRRKITFEDDPNGRCV